MTRSADYTIQGFLYQFNKTLLELLKETDETQITVEGIIEDIDIENCTGIKAIQCKYHEGQTYSLSKVYKPLLQMMHHFYVNDCLDVSYILYAHFPDQTALGPREITVDEINTVLSSTNKDLLKYIDEIKGKVDIDKFLERFSFQFGESFANLVNSVQSELKVSGFPDSEIETLTYPNAIQEIANLSIQHNVDERKVTKIQFIEKLKTIRKTAISRWTLALKTKKQILDARRKQLKKNLDKNARLRYFVISPSSIEDFDSGIVLFINDYLDKYHFKTAHIRTPLFCIDCPPEKFDDIRLRIHQKAIVVVDGYIGSYFDKTRFFRDPMVAKVTGQELKREFRARLLRLESNHEVLNEHKCDDLFIIGNQTWEGFDIIDINVEHLAVSKLNEIRYVLGVSDVFN